MSYEDGGLFASERPVVFTEKAVIATSVGEGSRQLSVVLFYEEGSYIESCVVENGIDADDIGIGTNKPGVSVWEGRFVPYRGFEDNYYEYDPKGRHRPLTDQELRDVRDGINPFAPKELPTATVVGITTSYALYPPGGSYLPSERVYKVRVEQNHVVRIHTFTFTDSVVTHDIPPEVDHGYGWYIRPITEAVAAYDRLTFYGASRA